MSSGTVSQSIVAENVILLSECSLEPVTVRGAVKKIGGRRKKISSFLVIMPINTYEQ